MNFETAQTTYGPSDRLSGILLHPNSLPSPYGIGDLGDGAYEFIDFLNKAGQHLWQVLPLNLPQLILQNQYVHHIPNLQAHS